VKLPGFPSQEIRGDSLREAPVSANDITSISIRMFFTKDNRSSAMLPKDAFDLSCPIKEASMAFPLLIAIARIA